MDIYEQHSQMVQDLKSKDYDVVIERMIAHNSIIDIQHGVNGLYSEGGEVADQLKRHLYYGTELDVINIKEELGDKLFYIQLIANACGFTLEEAMETNINKLRVRYGDKFSEDAATNRDLDVEREVLEK